MDTEKILIVGSSGMLGSALFRSLQESDYKVYGMSRNPAQHLNHYKGDVNDPETIYFIRHYIRPDVIIHCAAYVNLLFCEKNTAMAYELHCESVRSLAALEARLLYISTDSVFDGQKGNYSETDSPNPLNVYAETKRAGEEAALENERSLVIRTNIYSEKSPSGNSLAEWAIKALSSGERINGFDDIVFNPLHVMQLADAIELFLGEKELNGLWHLGTREVLSKLEFLVLLADQCKLNKELITGSSSDLLKLEPARPKNTSLNCNKFNEQFNTRYSLSEGLEFICP